MRLAFHDVSVAVDPSANGWLFDRIIRWRSGSDFVHVELVFSDSLDEYAKCFSAVPGEGVRWKFIDITQPQWRLVTLPANITAAKCLPIAQKYIGQKYDWLAMFGFCGYKLPWWLHPHNSNDKFCDEVCFDVLRDAGLWPQVRAWTESPADLYRMATALT